MRESGREANGTKRMAQEGQGPLYVFPLLKWCAGQEVTACGKPASLLRGSIGMEVSCMILHYAHGMVLQQHAVLLCNPSCYSKPKEWPAQSAAAHMLVVMLPPLNACAGHSALYCSQHGSAAQQICVLADSIGAPA